MCIGIFSFKHPGYSLILASNRDEYLQRATAPTSYHSFGVDGVDGEFVLSGVDLQAGGSWLGINKSGEIAMLTNITSPVIATDVLSRGDLVKDFLTRSQSQTMQEFVEMYTHSDLKFGGFNLLLLSPPPCPNHGTTAIPDSACDATHYRSALLSNNGPKGQIISAPSLSSDERVGAISNAPGLGTACGDWPKVDRGKCLLKEILETVEREDTDEEELVERLFGMMRWRAPEKITKREDLALTIQVPPIDHLAGIYGTRLSTVILIRDDGSVRWLERDIFQLQEGKPVEGTDQREFTFAIAS